MVNKLLQIRKMPRNFPTVAELIKVEIKFIEIQETMKEYIEELETKKDQMTRAGDNKFFK